jgi:hypothetical protein
MPIIGLYMNTESVFFKIWVILPLVTQEKLSFKDSAAHDSRLYYAHSHKLLIKID